MKKEESQATPFDDCPTGNGDLEFGTSHPQSHARDADRSKLSPDKACGAMDFSSELIRSMHDGFSVLDLHGVIQDVNPAFCQMTGFALEELVGVEPPHPYWPPEEIPRIQESLEETLHGRHAAFELTFMRKNGQRFPVIVSAFAVLNRQGETVNYAATIKDVTDIRKAHEAMRSWNQKLERRVAQRTAELKLSEDRFRQLSEATFEGVVVSENGVVIDVNSQICLILKCEMTDMLGRKVIDFVAPESRALVSRMILQKIEAPYECMGLLPDGTTVHMEVYGRMMVWRGKVSRVTAVKDLTTQKLAEAKLSAQKIELDQAMRLAIVSEISAGIVHQIGQPLTAVGVNLAATAIKIKSGEVSQGTCLQMLEDISANVAQMRKAVSHLKALANPDLPNHARMSINWMVSEALDQLRAEAGRRQVELIAELTPDLQEIMADSIQLSQVVINLVRNAMDACSDCPFERRKILVQTRVADKESSVMLAIRDSGTGIDPISMKLLYSAFYTTKADGFGIGLRLSRTIVQAHGGSIEGYNNPDGIGATFQVVLPIHLV